MSTRLESLINNEINGNLTTAKRQARSHSEFAIAEAYIEHGYSERKARLTAAWLKGADCRQAACDAE